MTILFAASEVGSARALLPVCQLCDERGESFAVLERGYMAEAAPSSWIRLKDYPEDVPTLQHYLEINNIGCVYFSMNVHDTLPLKVARAATMVGIPVVHVLDYWHGYRARMELDGQSPLVPTAYIVPDAYAKDKAIEEGINADCIRVLGQPALADTIEHYESQDETLLSDRLVSQGVNIDKPLIVFVSEPVAADQGTSVDENPEYRGYTEKVVLKILVEAIRASAVDAYVCVMPHPREDVAALNDYWQQLSGNETGSIVTLEQGRDILPMASAVTGMSSTLLYEAWLLGMPVASIQPGLRNAALGMFAERDGVLFISDCNHAVSTLSSWFSQLERHDYPKRAYRSEAKLHRHAAENILDVSKHLRAPGISDPAVVRSVT